MENNKPPETYLKPKDFVSLIEGIAPIGEWECDPNRNLLYRRGRETFLLKRGRIAYGVVDFSLDVSQGLNTKLKVRGEIDEKSYFHKKVSSKIKEFNEAEYQKTLNHIQDLTGVILCSEK